MTRKSWIVVVAMAIGAVGCHSSSLPNSATPIGPSAPLASYTLTGIVSRASGDSIAPVEGVRVEVANGCVPGRCGQSAMTDGQGFYRLSGVPAGNTSIRAMKWGHATVVSNVTVAGDMGVDLQIVRDGTYTLSGVVFEVNQTGLAAVENVSVYCDICGEGGHTWAETNADGFYFFPEVLAGATPILVRKDGYAVVDPTRTFPDGTGQRIVVVAGDTHFDIQLVRR